MKNAPVLQRNLEDTLNVRETDHALFTPNISASKSGQGVDFCSNDILHLGSMDQIRAAFEKELASHPGYNLYSGGVRMLDCNFGYIQQVEREIAEFHDTGTALVVNSGFEGNGAIFGAIPHPGDAIIYDELVHASTLDGMVHSVVHVKHSSRHNDCDSFREVLATIIDSQRMVHDGRRCNFAAVEPVYSTDGNVCPLRETVDIAKEDCPTGNIAFIIDGTHSSGVVRSRGAGLVNAQQTDYNTRRKKTSGKSFSVERRSAGENLRLYSDFPVTNRVAACNTTLGTQYIPKGTEILSSPWHCDIRWKLGVW